MKKESFIQLIVTVIVICLVLFFMLLTMQETHAQVIPVLPQFVSTTTPTTAITQAVFGRALKLTGLTTGECLGLDSNNLVIATVCGGAGSNFLTNSGINTYLNTGSQLQAPYFNATSTTAVSTFAGSISLGSTTAYLNNLTSNLTATGTDNFFINAIPSPLLDITQATDNFSEGTGAGVSLTTGSFNLFLGNGAGEQTTTGNYDTFLGETAGQNNTIGNYNFMTGLDAGNGNTSGSYNFFLGKSAGQVNTTGSYNFYGGYNAGFSNNSSGGVGIGYQALLNDTSASSTALGYSAGATLTTGIGDMFLGNNTDVCNSASSGVSSTTVIGFNACSSSSNSIILGGDANNKINVGIGTTSPGNKLSVQGDILFTASSTGLNGINLRAGCFASNGVCISGGSSQWTTNGSDIYYTTGNVGIGSTTPDFFNRPVYSTQFATSSLVVTGNALFGGNALYMSNGLSGQVAPFVIATGTRDYYLAGATPTTTAPVTGQNNIVAGLLAGNSLTNSSSEILMGANSGRFIMSGSNICLGPGTCEGNAAIPVSGASSGNIGIGSTALIGLQGTAATDNSCVGVNSCNGAGSPVTGAKNSALGFDALNALTSGTENVGIGDSALTFLTTGNDNVGIGLDAGNSLIDGTGNFFIGPNSGALFQHGNYNIMLGPSAGQEVGSSGNTITGDTLVGFAALGNSDTITGTDGNETAIGYQAGVTEQVGTLNTYIGYGADTSQSGIAVTNVTVIGAKAIVSESNAVILGNLANIGIGTSSPFATTSIQSNSSTGDAFSIATSSGATVSGEDNGGHGYTSGPPPAISTSTCGTGTGTVVGDDQSGTVTTATAATACTMTFAKAYQKTPTCTVTDNSLVGFADISNISTTAVTFGISSALTGGNLYYQCTYHR